MTTVQSETLKPCPFCGGDAQMRGSSDGEVEWYQCRRCAYESPPHYSQAKAIAAWNNRTPTPPAVSAGLVERLRAVDISWSETGELCAEAAHHIAAQDAEIARLQAVMETLGKIMPIRVEDGRDYAEVYFADGSTHSTQAMTMNPQDWRDIAAALTPETDHD